MLSKKKLWETKKQQPKSIAFLSENSSSSAEMETENLNLVT